MQYLRLFFSADQLPPVSQLKPIRWSTDLYVGATTKQLGPFQLSFYGLPIGSFPTFKGHLKSLTKTPLKRLVSCLLTFQQCHFNFQLVHGILVSLEISMLISFRKLEPPYLSRWSVPCSSTQLSPNPLHPVSQMEMSLLHIFPPILTVPFQMFILGNWSSHCPYALSFPPSLPKSKPFTIVLSQS